MGPKSSSVADRETDNFEGQLYAFWRSVASNYSMRDLTFHQDKLPALSGLTKRMYLQGCKTNYLAGLWEGDLRLGLLWFVESRRPNAAPGASVPYLGPSWSWISQIDRQVSFVGNYNAWNLRKLAMTVIGSTCVLATENPFGPVKSGYLLLSGTVKHAKAIGTLTREEIRQFGFIQCRFYAGAIKDNESGQTIGGISFDDDVQPAELVEFEFLLIAVGCSTSGNSFGGNDLFFRGLALVRKDGSEDYERIGLATIAKQDWFGNIKPCEDGRRIFAVDDDQKYRK